jgi:hypothetical protein
MAADLTQIEAQVRAAVARHGWLPQQVVLISPLGARKGVRYAFRIDTADGRRIKARHFGCADAARRAQLLRRDLEDAFAPVLARHDAVLIEAWLEGEMLEGGATAWTAAGGALLGRLHATPLASRIAARDSSSAYTQAALADLDVLRAAQALSDTAQAELSACLRRTDPGTVRLALVHRDFCAENMLIDGAGKLRIIDTELIGVAAAGFDLAWTWFRWPMPLAAWQRFLAAYREATTAPEAASYWRLVSGLTLGRVYAQRAPERLAAQLDRLRAVVDAGGNDAW